MADNLGPNSGSSEVSKQSAKRFNEQIAKWIAILQEHFQTEISSQLADIYLCALRELTIEELDRGCSMALRTCKFFPRLAEILELAKPPANDLILLEAERAWENHQRRIGFFCCDESGIELPRYQGGKAIQPPALDPATEYAVRQCGGRYAIEYCNPENLHFVRRDFISAYSRFAQTGGLKHLRGRFADLPAEIRDGAQKALKPMERKPQ
jgi:hypothetical protein